MQRTVSLLLLYAMVFALTACGQSVGSKKQEEIQPTVQKTDEQSESSPNEASTEKPETKE